MAIIAEVSWDQFVDGHFPQADPFRQAFRDAVEEVADKARTALPQSNGRIDKAVHLILNSDISIDANGEGTVASQSNGTGAYNVGKGFSCPCKDQPKSPRGLCKHLLCYHIFTRATALAKQRLAELDAATNGTTTPTPDQPTIETPVAVPMQEPVITPATPALPEAPASANCFVNLAGHKVQITLRDSNEEQLLSRMEKLLSRFPTEEPASTTPPEGWCHKHNVQMKLNHGKRGTWWSHKLSNGQWYNQK
jgi:hypothetical protein